MKSPADVFMSTHSDLARLVGSPSPEGEPSSYQPVAIDLQNDRGVSGPDCAWLKLRDGRVIEIGDEGLNIWRSLSDFERGFEPEHSLTFEPHHHSLRQADAQSVP